MASDIDELVKRLSLTGASNLGKAHILELQKTLFEACRIHDPTNADAMAEVLAKMQVSAPEGAGEDEPSESSPSKDNSDPAASFAFTSPQQPRERESAKKGGRSAFEDLRKAEEEEEESDSSPGGSLFSFASPTNAPNKEQAAPAFEFTSPMAPAPPAPASASPLFEFTSPTRVAPPAEKREAFKAPPKAEEIKFALGAPAPSRPKPKERKARSNAARRLDFADMSLQDPPEQLPVVPPPPPAPPGTAPAPQPELFSVGVPPPPPLGSAVPRAPRKKATPPRREADPAPMVTEPTEPTVGFCLGKSEGGRPRPNGRPRHAAKERIAALLRQQQKQPAPAPVVTRESKEAAAAVAAYDAAGLAYTQGRYSEAVASYSYALSQAPADWSLAAKTLGNRAAALTMLSRYSEALKDCSLATTLDVWLYKVHNRAARLKLNEGDSLGALESLEQARKGASRDLTASSQEEAKAALLTSEAALAEVERFTESLARALEGTARPKKQVSENEKQPPQFTPKKRAATAVKALQQAEEALAIAPRSKAARAAKARSLAILERWTHVEECCAQAAVSCSEAPGLDSTDSTAVAKSLSEESTTKKSLVDGGYSTDEENGFSLAELYVRCLRRSEAPDEAHLESKSRADTALRAVAAHAKSQPCVAERCSAELRRSLRLRRAKARADDAYTRGHYRAAVAMYKDALRLDSHLECDALRATLHCNVAAAALVLDRSPEAIEHCTDALKLRPQYARARLRRARARARIGDADEALHDYDAYLRTAKERGEADDQLLASVRRERRKVAEKKRSDAADARSRFAHQNPTPTTSPPKAPPPPQQRRAQPAAPAAKNSFFAASSRDLRQRVLSNPNSTHYALLGLARDALPVDAKKAYAKLALEYHPDRNLNPGATATMARINAAYEVLRDRSARAQYDLTLPSTHGYNTRATYSSRRYG